MSEPSSASVAETDDSLVTITPSLEEVILTHRDGVTFSAMRKYVFPFSEETRVCERLNDSFARALLKDDYYWEPELERGSVAERLRDGGRVLDLGCGMGGIWLVHMATRFEKAELIGLDLNPVSLEWAPPNVYFQVCNVYEGLPFPNESFDVVHVRFSGPWISIKHRMPAIRRVLRPRGIFLFLEGMNELHRSDGSIAVPSWLVQPDPWATSWQEDLVNLSHTISRNEIYVGDHPNPGELVNVQEDVVSVHLGIDSSLPRHLERQKAGTLLREALLGYFRMHLLRSDDTVGRIEKLTSLADRIPPEDSGLFCASKSIWARKGDQGQLVD